MSLPSISNYLNTEEKHERLWKEAIVVFDTSSLLDLYFYSENTQQSIINEIFKKLKGRLWLPNQVSYEFQKNRKKVILKPITLYESIENDLSKIQEYHKKLLVMIGELKSKTKKNDKHPYIDQNLFAPITRNYEIQENELKNLVSSIRSETKSKTDDIKKMLNNDKLFDAINTYFEVGAGFSFESILLIIEEGRKRYEYQIPPGYEDGNGKNKKEGIQIFGDLLIWKEILNFSKEKKKSIILICNDLKSDWCYKDNDNPGRIDSPREELIREILDNSGVEFWMYSTPQLLHYAKQYLNSSIAPEQIKEVSDISDHSLYDKNPSCIFTWPVNETTASEDNPLAKSLMYLIGDSGKPIFIDWGDGSPIEQFKTNNTIFHNYPTFNNYKVKIYGDLYWFCAMNIASVKPQKWFHQPKVSELIVSPSVYLDRLQCHGGTLKELDISQLPNLSQLIISTNQIANLDLSNLSKLTMLYCSYNLLTELDLSHNPLLKDLECYGNQLETLDIKLNRNIVKVNCSNNKIKSILIKNNLELNEIDCSVNLLSSDSLNNLFRELPIIEGGRINIKYNPGTDTCDKSIIEAKGWSLV